MSSRALKRDAYPLRVSVRNRRGSVGCVVGRRFRGRRVVSYIIKWHAGPLAGQETQVEPWEILPR